MFEWGTAFVQILSIGLIFLFFYCLFKFVKSIVQHFSNTKTALNRIEEKLDLVIHEKEIK